MYMHVRECECELSKMASLLYCRFQYILNAATSPATRMSEETLTYLNQGIAVAFFSTCSMLNVVVIIVSKMTSLCTGTVQMRGESQSGIRK